MPTSDAHNVQTIMPDQAHDLPRSGPSAAAPDSRFSALCGRAGPGLTTDQIMALTRGDDS